MNKAHVCMNDVRVRMNGVRVCMSLSYACRPDTCAYMNTDSEFSLIFSTNSW